MYLLNLDSYFIWLNSGSWVKNKSINTTFPSQNRIKVSFRLLRVRLTGAVSAGDGYFGISLQVAMKQSHIIANFHTNVTQPAMY